MVDGRSANVPPFQPNPPKPKNRKSQAFQFRLHPDDEFEREFKIWIEGNKIKGWSVRGQMKELFRQYLNKPQPLQVDPQDFEKMANTVSWIADQIASGALVHTTSSETGSDQGVIPDNIKVVIDHFRERGPGKRELQLDED